MSNISTRHNVHPFISGESKPLTGQRMCKIGYKNTKKQAAKYKNHFASIPTLTLETIEPHLSNLAVFLIPVLEGAQDGIVKSLFESSDGTLTSVSDEEISITSCIAYLHAQLADSSQLIGQWFDGAIAEQIIPTVAGKCGFTGELTQEQEERIVSIVEQYKDLFLRIISADGKSKNPPTKDQLKLARRIIEIVECEDSFAHDKFLGKLAELEKKPDMAALLEL